MSHSGYHGENSLMLWCIVRKLCRDANGAHDIMIKGKDETGRSVDLTRKKNGEKKEKAKNAKLPCQSRHW